MSLLGGLLGLTTSPSFADGTSVEVNSVSVSSGETGTVEIAVKGVTDPNGLVAYQLVLEFDPAAIQIENISGGDAPFNSAPTTKVDNKTGQVSLKALNAQRPGPMGDVTVAHLDIRVIGTIEETSGDGPYPELRERPIGQYDGASIPAALVDGSGTIKNTTITGGSDPATPVPATAPTQVPSVNNSNQAILPTLPLTTAPNTAGGTAAGGAGVPPATPLPATEPQTQGVPPCATVSTPTLTAPALTLGQDPEDPAVSPNAIATSTPESLVTQRLEISPDFRGDACSSATGGCTRR